MQAARVEGGQNVVADGLSRCVPLPSEWEMHPLDWHHISSQFPNLQVSRTDVYGVSFSYHGVIIPLFRSTSSPRRTTRSWNAFYLRSLTQMRGEWTAFNTIGTCGSKSMRSPLTRCSRKWWRNSSRSRAWQSWWPGRCPQTLCRWKSPGGLRKCGRWNTLQLSKWGFPVVLLVSFGFFMLCSG